MMLRRISARSCALAARSVKRPALCGEEREGRRPPGAGAVGDVIEAPLWISSRAATHLRMAAGTSATGRTRSGWSWATTLAGIAKGGVGRILHDDDASDPVDRERSGGAYRAGAAQFHSARSVPSDRASRRETRIWLTPRTSPICA